MLLVRDQRIERKLERVGKLALAAQLLVTPDGPTKNKVLRYVCLAVIDRFGAQTLHICGAWLTWARSDRGRSSQWREGAKLCPHARKGKGS